VIAVEGVKKDRLRRKGSRVTVFDVAREAQVSIATVSKVLNRMGSFIPISSQTREKVLAAASALNYQPDFTAQSLRSRRTHTIGLVVANVRHPYFSEIIGGVDQACQDAGYVSLLSSAEDNPEREKFCINLFQQKRVDGILLAGETASLEDEAIFSLVEKKIPVVLVARELKDERVPQVTLDNRLGGKMAVKHLLSLGHRRIACLAGPYGKNDSELRLEGYRLALEEAGLPYDPELVAVGGGIIAEDGYREMKRLLELPIPPTAVFCYNDTKAFGALKALQEARITVPDRMSVVGFDDIEFCDYSSPPLTSIRQPRFDMGYRAAKTLLHLLQNPETEIEKQMALKPKLTVRNSTGPM
jgi:LacI family transcriptional regulator